jgi:hypothetical protein
VFIFAPSHNPRLHDACRLRIRGSGICDIVPRLSFDQTDYFSVFSFYYDK